MKKREGKDLFLRFNLFPAVLYTLFFDLCDGLYVYISWIEQILLPFEKSLCSLLLLKFLDITLPLLLDGVGHLLGGLPTQPPLLPFLVQPLLSSFWERIFPSIVLGEQIFHHSLQFLTSLQVIKGQALLLLKEGGEILFFSASSLILFIVEGGSLSYRATSSLLTSFFLLMNEELCNLASMYPLSLKGCFASKGGEGTLTHSFFISLYSTIQDWFSLTPNGVRVASNLPLTPIGVTPFQGTRGIGGVIPHWLTRMEPVELFFGGVGLITALGFVFYPLYEEDKSFYRGMSETMLRIRAQQDVHCDIFMLAKVKGEVYRERLRMGKKSLVGNTEMQDFLYNITERELLKERGELGGEVLSPTEILGEVWDFEVSRIMKRGLPPWGTVNPPSAEEAQAAIYKTIERSLYTLPEQTRKIFQGGGQNPFEIGEPPSAQGMALWIEEQMISSRRSEEYEKTLLEQFRGVFDYQTILFTWYRELGEWGEEMRENLHRMEWEMEERYADCEESLRKSFIDEEHFLRNLFEEDERNLRETLLQERESLRQESEKLVEEVNRFHEDLVNKERLRAAQYDQYHRTLVKKMDVESWKSINGMRLATAAIDKADILDGSARALRAMTIERMKLWNTNAEIRLQNYRTRDQKFLRNHYKMGTRDEVEKQAVTLKALFGEEKKQMERERDEIVQLYIHRIMEIKGERDEALSRLRWIRDRGEVLFQLHSISESSSTMEGVSNLSTNPSLAMQPPLKGLVKGKDTSISVPLTPPYPAHGVRASLTPLGVRKRLETGRDGEEVFSIKDTNFPYPVTSEATPLGEIGVNPSLPDAVLKEGGFQPAEGLGPLDLPPSFDGEGTPSFPYPVTSEATPLGEIGVLGVTPNPFLLPLTPNPLPLPLYPLGGTGSDPLLTSSEVRGYTGTGGKGVTSTGGGPSFKTNLFGRYAMHLREDLLTLLQITREEASSLTPTELLDYAYVRFQFLNVETPLEPPETLERREGATSLLSYILERGESSLLELDPLRKETLPTFSKGKGETPPLQSGEPGVPPTTPFDPNPVLVTPLPPLLVTQNRVSLKGCFASKGLGGKENGEGVIEPPLKGYGGRLKGVDPLYGSGFDTNVIGASHPFPTQSLPLTGELRGGWNLLSREKIKFFLKKRESLSPNREGVTPSTPNSFLPPNPSFAVLPPKGASKKGGGLGEGASTGGTGVWERGGFVPPTHFHPLKGTGTRGNPFPSGKSLPSYTKEWVSAAPKPRTSFQLPELITVKRGSNLEKDSPPVSKPFTYPLGSSNQMRVGELPPPEKILPILPIGGLREDASAFLWVPPSLPKGEDVGEERPSFSSEGFREVIQRAVTSNPLPLPLYPLGGTGSDPLLTSSEGRGYTGTGGTGVRASTSKGGVSPHSGGGYGVRAKQREDGEPMGGALHPGSPASEGYNETNERYGNVKIDRDGFTSHFEKTKKEGEEEEVVFPPWKGPFSRDERQYVIDKFSQALTVWEQGAVRLIAKTEGEEILPYEEAIEALKEVQKGALKKDKNHWEWYYRLLDDSSMYGEELSMVETEERIRRMEEKMGREKGGLGEETTPPREAEKNPPRLPPYLPPSIIPREELPPEPPNPRGSYIPENSNPQQNLPSYAIPKPYADIPYFPLPHMKFIDPDSLEGDSSRSSKVDDFDIDF